MREQLARRRKLLAAGDERLGWKIGFGSPAAMATLGTDAPLVGFLTRRALVPNGVAVPVGAWTRPVVEPEIAVHLRHALPGGAGRTEAGQAIGALAPALELADVDGPSDDPEAILVRNVFQRAVVLGPATPWAGRPVAGLDARVSTSGRPVAATGDPEALTGDTLALLAHAASVLAAAGEELAAGDIVITGSVVPPLAAAAGDTIELALTPLGRVAVTLVM